MLSKISKESDINSRFSQIALGSIVVFVIMFFLFLSLGERFFSLEHSLIFGFLAFVLAVIFSLWMIFTKSMHSYYTTKFEAIDKSAKETLHELSTPIATIQANCKLLTNSTNEPKVTQRINRISKAAERLTELYEELEWTIKNDSGVQPQSKVMFDELIETIINDFTQKAVDKNIKITKETEQMMLQIDLFGLKKAVSNIIDNAIKYADNNTTVEIILKSKILTVKNSGIEIKAEELLSIFDKYYRGEHDQKGYGIGLNMVKNFCDKNNIDIKINSQNKTTTIELGFTSF